eukprot:TRINITY_DN17970_c0_g1_i1.p1 TRINITY_DN17970_c0_g1~~TRINITY_DN17970_c0_g1_i1.p1  ORF type:complete len:440 (-),score=119.36 TRINITY_DN17970_c0_g1_i1:48-1202(-)
MAQNGLRAAGYEYVLIDDGWSACDAFNSDGSCAKPVPRADDGSLIADPEKFPSGMAALAEYVHSLGMKLGIYTAVSSHTCAQYLGSLGNEDVDARTFAAWGMDFVKFDTCNYDCGIHDGCIPKSVAAMRDALAATNRTIVLYLDDGNDSTGQRLHNPKLHHVPPKNTVKVGDKWTELAWNWPAYEYANMYKTWFDMFDTWESFMDNLHMQIQLSYYQECGGYNFPDMVTIGQGAQTAGQYRAQMFLFAVLGSPIILGCDPRNITADVLALLTAPEVLAVDQDSDCVQGSLLNATNGATEIWGKPLSDGSFAVALLNKGTTAADAWVHIMDYTHSTFYPAQFQAAHVRDLWLRKDLGVHQGWFKANVPAQDCLLYKFSPVVDTEY